MVDVKNVFYLFRNRIWKLRWKVTTDKKEYSEVTVHVCKNSVRAVRFATQRSMKALEKGAQPPSVSKYVQIEETEIFERHHRRKYLVKRA